MVNLLKNYKIQIFILILLFLIFNIIFALMNDYTFNIFFNQLVFLLIGIFIPIIVIGFQYIGKLIRFSFFKIISYFFNIFFLIALCCAIIVFLLDRSLEKNEMLNLVIGTNIGSIVFNNIFIKNKIDY